MRLAGGGKTVVKLNTSHTVAHIKQEIMARLEKAKSAFSNSNLLIVIRDPEQTRREFSLLSLGPPSRELADSATIEQENLLGSAVIQRLK